MGNFYTFSDVVDAISKIINSELSDSESLYKYSYPYEISSYSYNYPSSKDTAKPVNKINMPQVSRVIFSENATIVFFEDNSKVIVRKSDKDIDNREHAIIYAIVKRAYGVVNSKGIVEGNGMGNMLGRIIKNAIVQNVQKSKKEDSKKEDLEENNQKSSQSSNRDSHGRFVKKSNH